MDECSAVRLATVLKQPYKRVVASERSFVGHCLFNGWGPTHTLWGTREQYSAYKLIFKYCFPTAADFNKTVKALLFRRNVYKLQI